VREERNQEILKIAKEKESQIVEEKGPQTIVLMPNYYNELVNTPSDTRR